MPPRRLAVVISILVLAPASAAVAYASAGGAPAAGAPAAAAPAAAAPAAGAPAAGAHRRGEQAQPRGAHRRGEQAQRRDPATIRERGRIPAVGAESQYANVISQIGGRYVSVTALMRNPDVDPHTFEANPSAVRAVDSARLIVQNGLGYDAFMNKIESDSSSTGRELIDVQTLLGLPDSTANPHLWYKPRAALALAAALARDLSRLDPSHASYFAANAQRFDASLRPWLRALKRFSASHRGSPVATTEPVGDYLLSAVGARDMTPWQLQADIMNGVDPAPQAISIQDALLGQHRVKALLYNRQVADALTQRFVTEARSAHVPVVAVYETLPVGLSYQRWMLMETEALNRAVTDGTSTTALP